MGLQGAIVMLLGGILRSLSIVEAYIGLRSLASVSIFLWEGLELIPSSLVP